MTGFRIVALDGEPFVAFPFDDVTDFFNLLRGRLKDSLALKASAEVLGPPPASAEPPRSGGNGERAAAFRLPMRAPAAAARAQGRAAGKPGAAPVARPITERPFYETVLAAIKKLGKADIAAIMAELERQRFPLREPLEHAVGDAIYASLKVKGLVEPVEDELGWWRAVKP